MLAWFIVFISLAWFVVFRYRRRNMYKLAAKLPDMKDAMPIIGIAHSLVGNTEGELVSFKVL